MGLFRSEVSLTFGKPTIAFVIPFTVPVNVAPDNDAFASSAVCVAVEMVYPDQRYH